MALSAGAFEVPGKWVLAGEHAVLRGGAAIVVPYPEVKLRLTAGAGSEVEPASLAPWLREVAARHLPGQPIGAIRVESTIPLGAGLGSSAALSVAVARWLRARGVAEAEDLFTFARELEAKFHGASSGMDIAAVLAEGPILYRRGEPPEPLPPLLARVTLHDTGLRAETRGCIAQVDKWRAEHSAEAAATDAQMADAAESARQGFARQAMDPEASFALFCRAFQLSHEVFAEWGLVPPVIAGQARELLAQGASAVRLTGAGGGGMLAALWRTAPKKP